MSFTRREPKKDKFAWRADPQFIPPWLSNHHTFSFSHLLFFGSDNILHFHFSATCFTCPDNNALVGGGDVQQEGSATPDKRQYFGRASKSCYSILSDIKIFFSGSPQNCLIESFGESRKNDFFYSQTLKLTALQKLLHPRPEFEDSYWNDE